MLIPCQSETTQPVPPIMLEPHKLIVPYMLISPYQFLSNSSSRR